VTPQIAGQVTEISNGVGTVTADPATNSLLIQASPEGYQALLRVIEQLDIARPQVLVEALIMEVTVGDGKDLGFNAVVRAVGGDQNLSLRSSTDSASNGVLGSTSAPARRRRLRLRASGTSLRSSSRSSPGRAASSRASPTAAATGT
jgi:type II secretory pathway component GspD/PulD (secretin)